MLGKGSSALKEKPTAYLKNVNRIPGPLTENNHGETRRFFVHYSARKYVPSKPIPDRSPAPQAISRGPANQQQSLAVTH